MSNILTKILEQRKYRVSIALAMLLLGCSSLLNSCMQMRTSNSATLKHFEKAKVNSEIITYSPANHNFSVRTIKTKKEDQQTAIFFVHGAPGSSNAFYDYLEDSTLLNHANLYSIDRPGYGYSNFGESMISIEQQTQIISEVIDSTVSEDKVLIVGHSYGGPIAAYVSLINDKTQACIMLAPANDPNNEKMFWFSHFARFKLTKWLLPKTFQVSGDEKFGHAQELENIEHIWQQIDNPTLHMHGKEDVLVPFENLAWTESQMDSTIFSKYVFEEENHFIPWTQQQVITEQILHYLRKM